ncbi:MAG: hypothetical protein HY737_09025 [Candidatus Omnitrophica bacterium]|nr:hypothetical protein [Candidatus Omnitrophota bacterium]
MSTNQHALLRAVEREVRRCRPLALRYFRSAGLRIERKADASPVTAADRAVEEYLRAALAKRCPGESIVGEEFGGEPPSHGTYWLIDPIDGTRAFSSGLPSWGILVAHVERGRPTLGVCDFPIAGATLAVAPGVRAYERGRGSPQPLPRPRAVHTLSDAVIFHGGAGWWQRTRYDRGFRRLIASCYLERAYGDCYGYLWALRAHADAVIDCGVKPYDIAPWCALAAATGRVLVNFKNQPSFAGPDSIMAAPALATLISATLRGEDIGI